MTHSVHGCDSWKLGWPKTTEELEGKLDGGKYTKVLDGMFHSLVGSAANVGEVLLFDKSDKSKELPLMVSFNAGKAIHTVRIETVEDRVTVLVPLEGKPVKHLLHEYKEIHWSFDDDAQKHMTLVTTHTTRVNPKATLATCVLTYEAAAKGKSHGIRVDTVSLKFAGEVGKEEAFWTDFTSKAPYKAETVQAAWDNHFGAFGAQDVAKIMLDYTEESVLRAFDHRTGKLDSCKGMAEIQKFFEGLFATLKDTSDLAAPTIDVTEDPKQVYLIWSCGASGIVSATDSFIFNDADNKISRQNIAFTSKA